MRTDIQRLKAKQMRWKKPIVADLNIDTISNNLYEIKDNSEEIQGLFDYDELILDAVDDDYELAEEFKNNFFLLGCEAEEMYSDIDEIRYRDESFDKTFNEFIVIVGGAEYGGGLLGFDTYENDYFGIETYQNSYAEAETEERFGRMTKKEIIEKAKQSFRILMSYLGLKYRYDCLKASIDILMNIDAEFLQTIKQIDDAYEKAEKVEFKEYDKHTKEFEKLIRALPDKVWVQ